MPIKKVNRKKYHLKWSLISYLIRVRRANNHCESCGVKNWFVGYWDGSAWQEPQADSVPQTLTTFKQLSQWAWAYNEEIGEGHDPNAHRICVVKLGVAHLDHNEQNNRFWNLKALCQCCHLKNDRRDNWRRRKYGVTGKFFRQTVLTL